MGNSTWSVNRRTWVLIPSTHIKNGSMTACVYYNPSIREKRQADPKSSVSSQPSWNYKSQSNEAGSYWGRHHPKSCSGLQKCMCGHVHCTHTLTYMQHTCNTTLRYHFMPHGCEGDLAMTSVTPLIANRSGWLGGCLLPPSLSHVSLSGSCELLKQRRTSLGARIHK